MVAVGRLSGCFLQSQAGIAPSQPDRAFLISKWKRCADREQPLPIPTYFGGSDKEQEEMHTLPLGVQQRGDLLFQSLTGTFFSLSSFGSHLCFCYYIILFLFNKKVGAGFEQKQIFLEKDHTVF